VAAGATSVGSPEMSGLGSLISRAGFLALWPGRH
jgi:hypothetical protein